MWISGSRGSRPQVRDNKLNRKVSACKQQTQVYEGDYWQLDTESSGPGADKRDESVYTAQPAPGGKIPSWAISAVYLGVHSKNNWPKGRHVDLFV